jgi:hypothetical protein
MFLLAAPAALFIIPAAAVKPRPALGRPVSAGAFGRKTGTRKTGTDHDFLLDLYRCYVAIVFEIL